MYLHLDKKKKKGFQGLINSFYVFRYVENSKGPTSLISQSSKKYFNLRTRCSIIQVHMKNKIL